MSGNSIQCSEIPTDSGGATHRLRIELQGRLVRDVGGAGGIVFHRQVLVVLFRGTDGDDGGLQVAAAEPQEHFLSRALAEHHGIRVNSRGV